MTVDLHEYKFISELERLPYFVSAREVDPEISAVPFPAWRAIFQCTLLWCHSTGYRLPPFSDFLADCERAFRHERHRGRFEKWFEPNNRERTEQRVRGWYESGMAETYLYACLVDAFEDILKDGIVLYDARVDWKHKADVMVISRGKIFAVDSFRGSRHARDGVKSRRDVIERDRKINTVESAHWGNEERSRCIAVGISRSDADCQNVNGVRLFSITAINTLLDEIYAQAGVERTFHFPQDPIGREQIYRSLIGRK
jgi:hypothetical protein